MNEHDENMGNLDEAAEVMGAAPAPTEPPSVPADMEPPPGYQPTRVRQLRERKFSVELATYEEIEEHCKGKYDQVSALHSGKALARVAVRAAKPMKAGELIMVVATPFFVSKEGKVSRGDSFADHSQRNSADGHNKLMERLIAADKAAAEALFAKAGVSRIDKGQDFGLPMIQGPAPSDVVGFLIERDNWLRAKAREVTNKKREAKAAKA